MGEGQREEQGEGGDDESKLRGLDTLSPLAAPSPSLSQMSAGISLSQMSAFGEVRFTPPGPQRPNAPQVPFPALGSSQPTGGGSQLPALLGGSGTPPPAEAQAIRQGYSRVLGREAEAPSVLLPLPKEVSCGGDGGGGGAISFSPLLLCRSLLRVRLIRCRIVPAHLSFRVSCSSTHTSPAAAASTQAASTQATTRSTRSSPSTPYVPGSRHTEETTQCLAAAGGSDRRGGKGSKRRRASDDELPPGELPSAGIARTLDKLHCWLAAALLFYYASPMCRREELGAAGGADCVVAEVAKVFQQLGSHAGWWDHQSEALRTVLHMWPGSRATEEEKDPLRLTSLLCMRAVGP